MCRVASSGCRHVCPVSFAAWGPGVLHSFVTRTQQPRCSDRTSLISLQKQCAPAPSAARSRTRRAAGSPAQASPSWPAVVIEGATPVFSQPAALGERDALEFDGAVGDSRQGITARTAAWGGAMSFAFWARVDAALITLPPGAQATRAGENRRPLARRAERLRGRRVGAFPPPLCPSSSPPLQVFLLRPAGPASNNVLAYVGPNTSSSTPPQLSPARHSRCTPVQQHRQSLLLHQQRDPGPVDALRLHCELRRPVRPCAT